MTATHPPWALRADPGSFRDPRSRVFRRGDQIIRAFNERGLSDYQEIADSEFFRHAIDAKRIIATRRLDAHDVPDGWAGAVAHDLVPVITYPYEWTFSMLRDAALLQLRLVRDGLRAGVGCKDGTSYNVQFTGGRPVFIDVGSFEPVGDDPWPGYRQFCSLYLYPLMLEAYLGVSFAPWLRGSLEGITTVDAAALFRGRARFRPGVLSHITLHAAAERRYATRQDPAAALTSGGGQMAAVVDALVGKLIRLVSGLEAPTAPSEWSGYVDRSHYAAQSLQAKDAFVEEVIAAAGPGVVADLGCNDGRFARIASRHAGLVVALDADRRVVDDLHRTLQDRSPNVVALLGDLADPSPGLGWDLVERRPLADRLSPDLVLSLALIHHLVIGRNIPVGHYIEHLARLAPHVVLEVPHEDDPMVAVLLGSKPDDTHVDYRLDVIEAAISDRFQIAGREELPGGTRTIYDLRRR